MAEEQSLNGVLSDVIQYFMFCKANAAKGSAAERKFTVYVEAVSDAKRLLKEQEPRVMTLEEVENLPYGHVLIETDKNDPIRWLDALLFIKNINFSFDFITLEGKARLLGTEYNREWRCWTARPTEEQRNSTPW